MTILPSRHFLVPSFHQSGEITYLVGKASGVTRDRSNRSLDTLPRAFKCRESPDSLTGLPVNFIRYYPHKFGDYIALRPVEEPNALPPI